MSQRRSLVISKCTDGDSVRILMNGVTVAEVPMQEWSRALVSPTTHQVGERKVVPLTYMAGSDDTSLKSLKEIAGSLVSKLNEHEDDHKEGA